MSSGSASFTDTTVHGKLEPPRSLHGVEDAEVIWDTITRRFPNAAPLLCEMETVIERAEDLLQQLKTPCTQGNDTSSSFHTPDSRESNATISMVSDIESFAEETNVQHREITENVETQLKVHDIHEKQTDLEFRRCNEQSIQYEKKPQEYHLNSPLRIDDIVQHFETSSMNKCHNSQEESNTDIKDNVDEAIDVNSEERLMKAVGEANSLEGWTNITDNALYDNDSEMRPSVDKNIDDQSLKVNNDDDTCDKNDEKVSVARCSANHRSPFTILEEYAKQCKVPIKYNCNKSKPNLYVINGDLCGFRAMSCAATEDLAKNECAAKILWMIAVRQMDGSKSVSGLLDFSRDEMLEIVALEGELKNASQKLYKLCLEKGESIPEYTTDNLMTHQGIMHTAHCAALGHVGVGQKSRIDSAKIAAAENLYQKYFCKEQQ
ncbi:hypothetical protein ALC62_01452 [Cyphomyrmex costatus]|uniref:DRBM domain-containing protein n=1 Tax=Cyphomyrmex costatus TaxID=456900 RepID=A0A195D422_9HYME|nr:hypothetical protein ALC62_01452 [Cyphomyrmex costatus]